MEYKEDTCGLVIGLLNNHSALSASSEKLFEEEFKQNIFSKYKKSVELYGGDIGDNLYQPAGYHLFGDCNMAVISLIDDFAFPNRVLHTEHGCSNNSESNTKYTLQIINGVHTWTKGACKFDSLEEKAKSTFLNEKKDKFPFIGIVNYKINNGLLIGNGAELLEILKRTLYQLKETVNYDIEMICIDSFSNNELVVIYFAHQLTSISSFTNETRILKLQDLIKEDNEAQIQIDALAKNSLLFQSLNERGKEQEEKPDEASLLKQVKDAHIFSMSFSHLGYGMTLPKSALKDSEKLSFQFQWDLKPGHYIDFKEAIIHENKFFTFADIEERIMPGTDTMQLIVKNIVFENFLSIVNELEKKTQLLSYIRKQRINVIFNSHGMSREQRNSDDHPELMKHLKKYGFSHSELKKLRVNLDTCRVSKVLKERTMKMYGTFNDGITDVLFFSYFIELKGYLEGIWERINNYGSIQTRKSSLEDFHTWLNLMIRNFEQAYYNRFHHSSRTLTISDFNLEYNGGIQQLISAYDTAYKIILRELVGDEANHNCVYVSGYERVSSDKDSLRINISHITYPELYAATVWKEAMNFYWDSREYTAPESLNQVNINANYHLMKDNESAGILKNRTLFNKGYQPESYVHNLMFNSINKDFIQYLIVDAFVYKIGYMGDFALFTYWNWHYFLQMSHFYNYEGEMQSEAFIKFLIRWLFIKRFAQDAASGTPEKYVAFEPKLAELWHCYIHEATTFMDVLLDELDKFDFITQIDAAAASWELQNMTRIKAESGKEFEENITSYIKEYIPQLSATLNEYTAAFEEGKIITIQRGSNTVSDFAFIRNLLFCYLQSVKKISESKNNHTHLLERNNDGKILEREQYCSILADSLGGMFIYDGAKRGEYFRLRSVFYKSLWGAGFQIKKDSLK